MKDKEVHSITTGKDFLDKGRDFAKLLDFHDLQYLSFKIQTREFLQKSDYRALNVIDRYLRKTTGNLFDFNYGYILCPKCYRTGTLVFTMYINKTFDAQWSIKDEEFISSSYEDVDYEEYVDGGICTFCNCALTDTQVINLARLYDHQLSQTLKISAEKTRETINETSKELKTCQEGE